MQGAQHSVFLTNSLSFFLPYLDTSFIKIYFLINLFSSPHSAKIALVWLYDGTRIFLAPLIWKHNHTSHINIYISTFLLWFTYKTIKIKKAFCVRISGFSLDSLSLASPRDFWEIFISSWIWAVYNPLISVNIIFKISVSCSTTCIYFSFTCCSLFLSLYSVFLLNFPENSHPAIHHKVRK